MNTQAFSWARGRAGQYAAIGLGAALALGAFAPSRPGRHREDLVCVARRSRPRRLHEGESLRHGQLRPHQGPLRSHHRGVGHDRRPPRHLVPGHHHHVARRPGRPPAVLDGTASGTVVTVAADGVTLHDLTIENGALGVYNSEGALTLTDSTVSGTRPGRSRTPGSGTTTTAPRLSSTALSRRTRVPALAPAFTTSAR